ncbi:hypothetical protein OSC27_00990 [Microbacterium sp. STN6]|uniref:hypothetical protein n=1 Tax=Microbacterium sp. STN6 TaxID=2995588 RepID=UPI002260FCD4|nr:hypothetical protein [Microbacterium sp. STN6]MCX7520848.1 hypothetical protein [Microbacterium sp. STN6]
MAATEPEGFQRADAVEQRSTPVAVTLPSMSERLADMPGADDDLEVPDDSSWLERRD